MSAVHWFAQKKLWRKLLSRNENWNNPWILLSFFNWSIFLLRHPLPAYRFRNVLWLHLIWWRPCGDAFDMALAKCGNLCDCNCFYYLWMMQLSVGNYFNFSVLFVVTKKQTSTKADNGILYFNLLTMGWHGIPLSYLSWLIDRTFRDVSLFVNSASTLRPSKRNVPGASV